jgi:type I restriction enzyme S subunit
MPAQGNALGSRHTGNPSPEGATQSKMPMIPLGQIAEVKLGKMLDKSKHTTGRKFPYLRNINVRWGRIDTSDLSEMFFKESEAERFSVNPGDVLVCEGGEPGRAAVWKGDHTHLKYQKALHRVRFLHDYEPRLLVYYLELLASRGALESRFTGSTIKHFTREAFVQLPVPNPPLPEQRRIVARIEELFSRLDAGVAALRHAKAQLQRYRQSVLAAAVTGQLTHAWREQHPDTEPAADVIARTEAPPRPNRYKSRSKAIQQGHPALSVGNPRTSLPKGWAWAHLVEIARMESGHTPSRNHPEWWDGDIPWIGIADAREHHGTIIHSTLQHTNEEGLANSASRLLPAGTVCISRTASVGYVTVMGCAMATSQDFVNWIPTKAVTSEWLRLVFQADTEGLRSFGSGSVHKTIYFPEWLSMHAAIPPLAEQHRIVAEVEARTTAIDHLEAELDRQITRSNRLRQSTLASAFKGEL